MPDIVREIQKRFNKTRLQEESKTFLRTEGLKLKQKFIKSLPEGKDEIRDESPGQRQWGKRLKDSFIHTLRKTERGVSFVISLKHPSVTSQNNSILDWITKGTKGPSNPIKVKNSPNLVFWNYARSNVFIGKQVNHKGVRNTKDYVNEAFNLRIINRGFNDLSKRI